MTLTAVDFDPLFDLADQIEDHPEDWTRPRDVTRAIRREAIRLRKKSEAPDDAAMG